MAWVALEVSVAWRGGLVGLAGSAVSEALGGLGGLARRTRRPMPDALITHPRRHRRALACRRTPRRPTAPRRSGQPRALGGVGAGGILDFELFSQLSIRAVDDEVALASRCAGRRAASSRSST